MGQGGNFLAAALLVAAGLLAGCAPQTGGNPLQRETRASLQAFAVAGSTTSADVLRRLRRPGSRGTYSDGRYSYIYTFSDFVSAEHPMRVEIHSPNASTVKIATFVFSPQGILQEWHFDENLGVIQRSKYDAMMNAQNSETSGQGEITAQQFADIAVGAQLGRVFAECGKPLHAQDISQDAAQNAGQRPGGGEKWIYTDADDEQRHFYLLFRDGAVVKTYWVRTTEGAALSPAEEAVLGAAR